jgi:hypothetical protein
MANRNSSLKQMSTETVSAPTVAESPTKAAFITGAFAVAAAIISGACTYWITKGSIERELRQKPGSVSVTVQPSSTKASIIVDNNSPQSVSKESPLARFDNLLPGLHQIVVQREGRDPLTHVVTLNGGDHSYFNVDLAGGKVGSEMIGTIDTGVIASASTLRPITPTIDSTTQNGCCWIFIGRTIRETMTKTSSLLDSPVSIEGQPPMPSDIYILNANATLKFKQVQDQIFRNNVQFLGHAGYVPKGTVIRIDEIESIQQPRLPLVKLMFARISIYGEIKTLHSQK